jgi:hypothetical protein
MFVKSYRWFKVKVPIVFLATAGFSLHKNGCYIHPPPKKNAATVRSEFLPALTTNG